MKFQLARGHWEKVANDCLVVGVYENKILSPAAQQLDQMSQGYLSKILKKAEITGKIGQTLLLHDIPHQLAERVLLVGCGSSQTELSVRHYRQIIAASIKAMKTAQIIRPLLFLTELNIAQHSLAWKIKQLIEVSMDALYQFTPFKSDKTPPSALQTIQLYLAEKKQLASATQAIAEGLAIAHGVLLTKNLANMPSNICTPTYLASQAKVLVKKYPSIKVNILSEKDMEKLGMGAFLAVAQGSAQDAKLICLEYRGGSKKQAPIALVGKGITFDTGGISLKSSDGMVGMKYDMCGAATVLGVMQAVAELELPLNLVGILAASENMPSGTAVKPEDIVTSLSGQTIEILNTDAEGRLVLCDALTYVERYKPEIVIDIATLTGAVVVALGHHATGLVANDQPLADALLAAGIESHDRAWQMPLWDEFQEQLKSPFADMSNIGGRTGGVITAGCFLSRFAKKFRWAHLDVAGTAAMMTGTDRYATGRPVPMLIQFLLNQLNKQDKK